MTDEPTGLPTDLPTGPPTAVPAAAGRLEGFWDGDFTLGANPDDPVPAPVAAIDELGSSGIRIGGRDLAALLAPAYRKLLGSTD